MSGRAPEARRIAAVSAIALALVLAVIVASAYIRLGSAATPPALKASIDIARLAHRVAASLAALAVLALALLAWRARLAHRSALGALAVTVFLSVLGAGTGTSPPPLAAAANLLGGLTLAALLAWTLGRVRPYMALDPAEAEVLLRASRFGLSLIAAQAVLGATVALSGSEAGLGWLLAHAVLGVIMGIFCAWLGASLWRAGLAFAGLVLTTLALLAPIAGTLAALFDLAPLAAIAHPALGALVLAALALSAARLAGARSA